MCIYIYAHIHEYICICMDVYVYVRTCIYMYAHMSVYTCKYTYVPLSLSCMSPTKGNRKDYDNKRTARNSHRSLSWLHAI